MSFEWPLLILSVLSLLSGFFSAWLGIGGSILLVPLLPVLSQLDSLSSLQLALTLVVSISGINTGLFLYQKLILWPWFWRAIFFSIGSSFLAGFFVSHLNDFQIRLILFGFLACMLILPRLLQQVSYMKQNKGFYIFSSLMGLCSGLTGLGGGLILSPYFCETKLIPEKHIPALVSSLMFCISFVSILGQVSHVGLSFVFTNSSYWWLCFFLLFIPAFLGLIVGHFYNVKTLPDQLRRNVLRRLIQIMFVCLSIELIYKCF